MLLASRKENKDVFFFMKYRLCQDVWNSVYDTQYGFNLLCRTMAKLTVKELKCAQGFPFGLYFVTLQILGSQGATNSLCRELGRFFVVEKYKIFFH